MKVKSKNFNYIFENVTFYDRPDEKKKRRFNIPFNFLLLTFKIFYKIFLENQFRLIRLPRICQGDDLGIMMLTFMENIVFVFISYRSKIYRNYIKIE